jgi:hypothetical protein
MKTTFFAFDDVHLSGDIAMRPPAPRQAALLVLAGTNLRRPHPCRARPSQKLGLFTLSKGAQAPLETQRSPLPGTPDQGTGTGASNCRFQVETAGN